MKIMKIGLLVVHALALMAVPDERTDYTVYGVPNSRLLNIDFEIGHDKFEFQGGLAYKPRGSAGSQSSASTSGGGEGNKPGGYVSVVKQIWRCRPCAKNRRRSMNIASAAEAGTATIADVIYMLEEAKEERKKLETDFGASIESCHQKIDENNSKIEAQNRIIEVFVTKIASLDAENASLRARLKALEVRQDDSEQHSRLNAVEIYGVPQEREEDIVQVVKKVGAAVDMDIRDEMIDACHRLGKARGRNGDQPPGIIVRFVRRMDKQTLMAKKKGKKDLTTESLGYASKNIIFVNDSITPTRRRILTEARKKKKEKGYAFVWVQNGKVLLRKEEKGHVIELATMEDVDKL